MELNDYLSRFKGVVPPRELRGVVLGAARRSREVGCPRWIVGAAAVVLVALALVNVELEARVRSLAGGHRETPIAEEPREISLPSDALSALLGPRGTTHRHRRIGPQSWFTLRAAAGGTKHEEHEPDEG